MAAAEEQMYSSGYHCAIIANLILYGLQLQTTTKAGWGQGGWPFCIYAYVDACFIISLMVETRAVQAWVHSKVCWCASGHGEVATQLPGWMQGFEECMAIASDDITTKLQCMAHQS